MHSLAAFPIPISYATLGEESRALNAILLKDIFDSVNGKPTQLRSGVGVRQTIGSLEEQYESFKELKEIIEEVSRGIVEYSKSGGSKISVEAFWANVNNDPFAFHMPHSHTVKYMFTGVYFPSSGISKGVHLSSRQNLDEPVVLQSKSQPDPGSLVLLDPLEFVKNAISIGETSRYPFFGHPISVTPKEATLVIFPSYLPHMVTPTKDPNLTRVSIAFNLSVE